jgi:hypothetical protein
MLLRTLRTSADKLGLLPARLKQGTIWCRANGAVIQACMQLTYFSCMLCSLLFYLRRRTLGPKMTWHAHRAGPNKREENVSE